MGNLCRSPTAEFLHQQALPRKTVHTAGLSALVDNDMDATARKVAEQYQLICPSHSARQLTAALCREADIILVMEIDIKKASAG
nr:hypothetical protein [Oceanisphaera sp. IT1-181]